MGYNRRIVWTSPFTEQFLPLGSSGLIYTAVLLDVPLINLRRDIWDASEILVVSSEDTEQFITLETTVPYLANSLTVFADGEVASFKESTRATKTTFELDKQLAKGKYIHSSYIPAALNLSLGDNRSTLVNVYNVVPGIRFSTKLRDVISLSRKYIELISKELSIEPPLWIGGKGNTEKGTFDNIIPSLTPLSVDLHLKPILDAIESVRTFLAAEGIRNIPFVRAPEYSVGFFEEVQKALITIDIILEERL